jgi:hypothetical protein
VEPRDKRLYIGGLCAFDGVLALVLQMLWQPKGADPYSPTTTARPRCSAV